MKNKLVSVMKLHGESSNDLAKVIGRSRSTLSLKLNSTNGADFTLAEIKKIKEHYALTSEQVVDIFFT